MDYRWACPSRCGAGTVIESLKRATEVPKTHFTRPYLDTKMFFGLDWIRNLGAAALSLNLNRTVYPDTSGLDVNSCPLRLPIRRFLQVRKPEQ